MLFKRFQLHVGLLTVVAIGQAAAVSAAAAASDFGRVFAPDSFWYRPIPANAPLHTNSANFVADFLRQKKAYYGTVSINTTAYASPVYLVGANTPVAQVTEWECMDKRWADHAELAKQWSAVPIPDYAEPADGTDAEMAIYQPSTDTIWEFWQARKTNGQWQACWGGRMEHASETGLSSGTLAARSRCERRTRSRTRSVANPILTRRSLRARPPGPS